MGFQSWLARRGIRGIVKSMCKMYKQAKAIHPNLDEAQLCQDVIGLRYRAIKPDAQEHEIILAEIGKVTDIYSACHLVVQAESGLNPIEDPSLYVQTYDIAKEEVDRFLK